MMGDKADLERELRVLSEIIALQEQRESVGDFAGSSLYDAQEIVVPLEYRYLLGLDREMLEEHYKRLERDLESLDTPYSVQERLKEYER